ncbi:MAG: glutamine-hydrolyzing GMP synthase, partial [Clostridia bacterium]
MQQDMIVILDMGSTENTLIARDIRELGVYSEIYPHDITAAELKKLSGVRGIILNGGENRVVDGVSVDVSKEIYECGYPIMAVDHKSALCDNLLSCWPQDKTARADVLRKFAFDKCHCATNWNMKNFVSDQIERVRAQVGSRKVLLALSGGVDSSVVAALLIRAIG